MIEESPDIRDRIKKVLKDHDNASIYSLAGNETDRVKMTRQINGQVKVSMETVNRILERFPDVSAEWLLRGEGLMDRTHIVMPQQHRQDIHIEGSARAAISQSGSATIEPDEPIGQESLIDLLNEKDARIAQLEKDLDTLKDAIRVLSAK